MALDQRGFEERYLSALNPQQRVAGLTTDGPVLLLATPGSGKITVLVTRLGYMILCLGTEPSTAYPKDKRASKQKPSTNAPSDRSQRRQRLIRGDTARHKTFGTGVVAKVEKDSVTVDFRSKGRKKFTLEAVNKGLLRRV